MHEPERIIDGAISPEVLSAISGRELLIAHLGGWPTFHDFEVVSITLERAPWPSTATRDMRATFFVFELTKHPEHSERNQALAELLFNDIGDLLIEGFNHQNPITGLSITSAPSTLSAPQFRVEWGGTLMKHDVSFSCRRISVLRVVNLNPFRRSISEP